MGTRLRNLVKSYKGTKTPIHGRGKLTDNAINSMQNNYGLAICNNTDNIYAKKKAVGAILWHCTVISDKNIGHSMCPRDEKTWCKWQLDKLKETHIHKKKIFL